MKNYTLILLCCLLFSSLAFGQQTHATIVVLADSSAGKTIYLKQFHAPGLDYHIVDSVVIANSLVVLHVSSDPAKPYELYLGHKYVDDDIYLAPGDSIVFSYNSLNGDSLLFDRMGANQSFRHFPKPWFRNRQYYRNFDSLDWSAWNTFLAARKDSLEQRASWFGTNYPTHLGLKAMYENEAIEGYYYGMLYYLERHYWDSTGRPITEEPSRFRILDSIPWNVQPFAESKEILPVATVWIYLEWLRWKYAGVDTTAIKYDDKAFGYAHLLPAPARDVAILKIIENLCYLNNPSENVPILEKELQTYRPFAYDTAYLGAFERKIAGIQSRLPGKSAPIISLPDTSGVFRSLADFRGKIIYLDFWGTWCGPCLEELPGLKRLENKFSQDTSVLFVSVALEASHYADQNVAAWKKCIRDKELSGVQLYADDQFQNENVLLYGIQAVPTFMLIDRNGNFIDAAAPRPSSGKAEDAIRAALSEP